jgi:hypothetical protein
MLKAFWERVAEARFGAFIILEHSFLVVGDDEH